MKQHHILSYSLLALGGLISGRAMLARQQWDEANRLAIIMLDWDDVQAVATRTGLAAAELLGRYQENGATHLSIPELTLNRLRQKGRLSLGRGPEPDRTYLQGGDGALIERIAAELQIRLPHVAVEADEGLLSFRGDLPTIAEVGLGFDPAQVELARQVRLSPVARPINYSWIQPEMIERTLSQAAALGVRIVAFGGGFVPGHEFNMAATVQAMQDNGLTYAYFSESRHQRGDWFLAKNLAPAGLVMLAHQFEPEEMFEDDWHTISGRWANLAREAGIRLCSVRFFRVLHAADPLESVAYIRALRAALARIELVPVSVGAVDLGPYLPPADPVALAGAGMSVAGALGLAADLLPLSDRLKLAGSGLTALALGSLPFVEKRLVGGGDHHHHHHHHHHDHDHAHDHPHHDHEHGDHHHHHAADRSGETTYAAKGIGLAAAIAYPAATIEAGLGRAAALSLAGAAALNATVTGPDYAFNVETYRSYNLDWLIPLGVALAARRRGWLPAAGLLALAAWSERDRLAELDREHRHAHTHHLSAFRRAVGDTKMALSLRPLRKWSALLPVGATGGSGGLVRLGRAAGQIATLAGFRNGQRSLGQTIAGRSRPWLIGLLLAGLLWLWRSIGSRSE